MTLYHTTLKRTYEGPQFSDIVVVVQSYVVVKSYVAVKSYVVVKSYVNIVGYRFSSLLRDGS
jgi:hypothetical protein